MEKTEQEQIEDLKRWWEKNGKLVVIGLVFLIAGVIGGQVWLDFQENTKARLSATYELIMQEMQDEQIDSATARASQLIEQNPDSAYAPLAAMALAKMEVDKGELDSARLRLMWARDHAQEPALREIAQLRLARVLLALDQLDAALAEVSGTPSSGFVASYAVVRGDIYARKGQKDLARTAYQSALNDAEIAPQIRNQVQLKLDDLGA